MSKLLHVIFVTLLAFCVSPLFAEQTELALYVQRSPDYGGLVTSSANDRQDGSKLVNIKATPSEGYAFVYWLGDVTDPTNSSTTVLLDSPKMVIAVFEKAELVVPGSSGTTVGSGFSGGGGFGGGLSATPNAYYPQPAISGGSEGANISYSYVVANPTASEEEPEPVPEPAALLLLGAGALVIARRKR